MHHVLALSTDQKSSPVIDRDAHWIGQPKQEAMIEEWKVTTMHYHAREKWDDPHCDFGALIDMRDAGLKLDEARRFFTDTSEKACDEARLDRHGRQIPVS